MSLVSVKSRLRAGVTWHSSTLPQAAASDRTPDVQAMSHLNQCDSARCTMPKASRTAMATPGGRMFRCYLLCTICAQKLCSLIDLFGCLREVQLIHHLREAVPISLHNISASVAQSVLCYASTQCKPHVESAHVWRSLPESMGQARLTAVSGASSTQHENRLVASG